MRNEGSIAETRELMRPEEAKPTEGESYSKVQMAREELSSAIRQQHDDKSVASQKKNPEEAQPESPGKTQP